MTCLPLYHVERAIQSLLSYQGETQLGSGWVGHSLKQEHATRLAFGQLSGVADESSETRPCVSHELPGPEPTIAVRLQEDEAPPRAQRRGLGGEGRS